MQIKRGSAAYYQKAAFTLRLARYLVAILFVLFIICCVFFFRNDITIENIQYLMKYADFYDNKEIPDNAEISITADSESHFFMLRDNLAIVSRSGIGLYEFSDRKLFNYNLSYSNPGVAHDDRNILVYDITGNEISIFNSFSRIYSQKFPYSVKSACINDSGFAVVTNEKTYRSGIIVYNSKFDEVFRWMSTDRYVTGVDLSIDGSKIVTCSVASQNGFYHTQLNITNIKTGEVTYSCEIPEELALKVGFSEDGHQIYLVTDCMLYFYNDKLELVNSFKYNQSKTEKYFVQDEKIILTESNNLSGSSMSIIGFDFGGNQLFNVNASSKISSVAYGKNKLFALSSRLVYVYSTDDDGSMVLENTFPTDSNAKVILADNNDRYITASVRNANRVSLENIESEA